MVDRRLVVNPRQARALLTAVTYVGRPWRGRHLRAFFACMYFATLRPGEVKALRKDRCYLPKSGWGRLTLSRSRPQSNKVHPAYIPRPAANGGSWLRLAAVGDEPKT